ncbi:MAG: hypothetical protein AAB701_00290 [Patescibacteria group bacterium]
MKKKITIDDLAIMIQNGFTQQAEEMSRFRIENQQEHTKIRRDISHLNFITTEHVHRNEFLELKADVEQLKLKRR